MKHIGVLSRIWFAALVVTLTVFESPPDCGKPEQMTIASAPTPDLLSNINDSRIRLARHIRGSAQAYHVGKNHELVRHAFREAIATANRSTVRVVSDGKFVSLGTIVGRDGWILTKASELSNKLVCRVPENGTLKASVRETDEQTDLALLKVDATGLPVAKTAEEWGAIDFEIKAGSFVAVPGGHTAAPLAIGIVSTNRPRSIDRDNGIIGIHVEHPISRGQGARVIGVFPGSAAEQSGLEKNDVIVELDGVPVEKYSDLVQRVSQLRPGMIVTVKFQRGDRQLIAKITLGRVSDLLEEELALQNRLGGRLSPRRSGFPNVIQHDSLVRANQCGGPLVNLDGEIIGINIARAGRVETYALTANSVAAALQRMMPKLRLTSEKSPL